MSLPPLLLYRNGLYLPMREPNHLIPFILIYIVSKASIVVTFSLMKTQSITHHLGSVNLVNLCADKWFGSDALMLIVELKS
jgi:hypothetical protein